MFTTGEIAKLCGVTVRTVQYYDTRGILTPSELSDGGRRLYSEADLRKMKMICFLRSLDLPIDSIGKLLREENAREVLRLLLEQQEQVLTAELSDRQQKLERLRELQKWLVGMNFLSVDSIGDIAYLMQNRKKRHRMLMRMLIAGLISEIFEWSGLVLGIVTGNWMPFIFSIPFTVITTVFLVRHYYLHSVYLCPACHRLFRPHFREFLFTAHTPNTRKLTCTECGHHGFCVETYGLKPTKGEENHVEN
ncbi:MAG: MerR family transcriptional regulator [Ruminococcaceae bacterium]|nr:MerR family transcriptional regulator [Oscillospiraceae bacterium]